MTELAGAVLVASPAPIRKRVIANCQMLLTSPANGPGGVPSEVAEVPSWVACRSVLCSCNTVMKRFRQLAAILFGLLAWYAVAIAADFFLVGVWGLTSGTRFAMLGAAELILGGGVIILALRLAGIRPAEIGWTSHCIRSDVLVGLMIAVLFAVVQFAVIIPATGGAGRSDIVANAAQIGETYPGLFGMLLLALLGSTSEELLFRGLLLGGIAIAFKAGTTARVLATAIVIVLFALSHGYQGWAGIVDTGFFGGLLLSAIYWWRDMRLAGPIAAHVGWNIIASIIIFSIY